MGEILLRGTAIAAATCYAARVTIGVARPRGDRGQSWARVAWSVGGLTLLLHVVCAFHVRHGWSHAAAWEHTRQRTEALTGWNTGVGLYANYAMTATWLIDIIGWSVRLDWPARFRVWFWFVQTFFAFMMFNATAVFGPWYWRPVAVLFGVMVLGIVSQRRHDASVKRR